MGTRSLTIFKDGDSEICVMYQQFDGYPNGVGVDLANILSNMHLVNGLRCGEDRIVANGMGCLVAQVIAKTKCKAGGVYIHKAETRDLWEDYVYTIYGELDDEVKIRLEGGEHVLFDDYASKYSAWILQYNEEEND